MAFSPRLHVRSTIHALEYDYSFHIGRSHRNSGFLHVLHSLAGGLLIRIPRRKKASGQKLGFRDRAVGVRASVIRWRGRGWVRHCAGPGAFVTPMSAFFHQVRSELGNAITVPYAASGLLPFNRTTIRPQAHPAHPHHAALNTRASRAR